MAFWDHEASTCISDYSFTYRALFVAENYLYLLLCVELPYLLGAFLTHHWSSGGWIKMENIKSKVLGMSFVLCMVNGGSYDNASWTWSSKTKESPDVCIYQYSGLEESSIARRMIVGLYQAVVAILPSSLPLFARSFSCPFSLSILLQGSLLLYITLPVLLTSDLRWRLE